MNIIGWGETAEVYKVNHGRVIKLFCDNKFDREAFDREFERVKYIGDFTSFAPQIFEEVEIEGRVGYEMEEIVGELFVDVIDEEPSELSYHANLLGKSHKKLHDVDVSGLKKLPKLKDSLRRALLKINPFSKDIMKWLVELLDSLPDGESLCHGDFMPYNIIYFDEKLKAIDWAESSVGPREADIARTLNFIVDTTDYEDALFTTEREVFIKEYADAYGIGLDSEILFKWLIINAVFEYYCAVEDNMEDVFSLRLKNFVENNYKKLFSDKLI